jgi:hypothetical protein
VVVYNTTLALCYFKLTRVPIKPLASYRFLSTLPESKDLKIEQLEACLRKANTNIEDLRQLLEREQRKLHDAEGLRNLVDKYNFEDKIKIEKLKLHFRWAILCLLLLLL